jgi:hypothetical protein
VARTLLDLLDLFVPLSLDPNRMRFLVLIPLWPLRFRQFFLLDHSRLHFALPRLKK